MGLDTSQYYRLTNLFQGPGQALDVKADGTGRLMTAPSADVSGQYWKLVDAGGGKYALRTLYLGDCFSLDVINDGKNDTPWLNATGDFTGQYWSVTPWGDGTWRLTNDFTGPDRSLNVFAESFIPFVGPGDHSGQHWVFNPLKPIGANAAIPELDNRGNTFHPEGPADYGSFARPIGTVKAVMVFVDFSDAPAGSTDASALADHILGSGRLKQLYFDQSYGKLTLDVDVKADLGWRRMPKPSSGYDLSQRMSQLNYISAAAALFPASSLRFSDYAMVFVVPPPGARPPLSPAFNPPGPNATSPSGDIRLAVTLGQDCFKNRFITLVHEIGHLFDLPDLYPAGSGADTSKAGCWPIMSDTFHSVSFLGWHRHKNGWLAANQKTYVSASGTQQLTLAPLSAGSGLSMVVLPVDDPAKPTKVIVIELAEPVLGLEWNPPVPPWGEGVLIYTVDATLGSGNSPVVILPRKESSSGTYGFLFEAPWGVGDVATAVIGSTYLSVRVIQKFRSSYNVRIRYRRESSWIVAFVDRLLDALGLLGP